MDAGAGILLHRHPAATLEDRAHSRCLCFWVRPGQMAGAALAHAYARSTRSPDWVRELCPCQACWWSGLNPAGHSVCERLAWTYAAAGVLIRTSTVDRLEQQETLAPIWLTMLPNQPNAPRQPLLDAPLSEVG